MGGFLACQTRPIVLPVIPYVFIAVIHSGKDLTLFFVNLSTLIEPRALAADIIDAGPANFVTNLCENILITVWRKAKDWIPHCAAHYQWLVAHIKKTECADEVSL